MWHQGVQERLHYTAGRQGRNLRHQKSPDRAGEGAVHALWWGFGVQCCDLLHRFVWANLHLWLTIGDYTGPE